MVLFGFVKLKIIYTRTHTYIQIYIYIYIGSDQFGFIIVSMSKVSLFYKPKLTDNGIFKFDLVCPVEFLFVCVTVHFYASKGIIFWH